MNGSGNERDNRAKAVPRYRLIDKDGRADSRTFDSAAQLEEWARHLWPDQEQDETRSGKGWDIEVVR